MNVYEKERFEELTRKGYKVLYRGYPDFLIFNPKTKEVSFEECKFKGDKVSPEQKQMHYYLEEAGLKVHVHYLYPKLNGQKAKKTEAKKVSKKVTPKPKKASPKQGWLDVVAGILEQAKANKTTGELEETIRTLHPEKIAHIKNLHGSIGSALSRAREGAHPNIKCQRMPDGKFEYWFAG